MQRSSISSALITCSISAASVGLIALRFSGRFIVTQAMPFSNSTSTVLPPGTGAAAWVFFVVTASSPLSWHPFERDEQYQSQALVPMIVTGIGRRQANAPAQRRAGRTRDADHRSSSRNGDRRLPVYQPGQPSSRQRLSGATDPPPR